MAVTKPLWVHTASHSGLDARLGLTAMFGGPTSTATSLTRPGGVVPGYAGGLKVSQTASPSMAVLVAAGAVQVPGAVAGQGDYLLVNDAPVSVAVGAYTGATRTDILIARVRDDSYGETSPGGYLEVVPGVPGGAVPSWAVVSGPAMNTVPSRQIRSRQPSGRIRLTPASDGTRVRQATTCGS